MWGDEYGGSQPSDGRYPAHRSKRTFHVLLSGAAALTIFLALSGTANFATAQSDFVPGFEDLPLMFELDASADAPVIFDTPAGRIIETRASGHSSKLRILAFYRDTLPQLGWHETAAEGAFQREGELLTLSVVEPRSGQVEVRFSLTPAPSAKH